MDPEVLKTARKALMKAIYMMQTENKLATVCLTAVAVAVRVLQEFEIPYCGTAGYITLPQAPNTQPVAIPHAWVVTSGLPRSDGTTIDAITDLAFTSKYRAVTLLGQNVYFDDDAALAKYHQGPDLPTGHLLWGSPEAIAAGLCPPDGPSPISVSELQVHAGDIGRYMLGAPEAIRAEIERVVKRVTTTGDSMVAAAPAGSAGGPGEPAGPAGPGNGASVEQASSIAITEELPYDVKQPPQQ
jgi:hypothetical protein